MNRHCPSRLPFRGLLAALVLVLGAAAALHADDRDFVRKNAPVSRLRQLRDAGDPIGFSRALWTKMAELGWPAIVVPERYGGLSMGMKEIACA